MALKTNVPERNQNGMPNSLQTPNDAPNYMFAFFFFGEFRFGASTTSEQSIWMEHKNFI